jgi:hypothetical protein
MEFITYAVVFYIGFLYSEYVSKNKRDELMQESFKTFENMSYLILGQLSAMHDNGLKALELVSQKCAEEDKEKQEEYAKIAEVFERKMNEFGETYMRTLKKHLHFKLKYNTYKDVKENFGHLINNKSEDDKNA